MEQIYLGAKSKKKMLRGKIEKNKWWKKKLLVRGKMKKKVGGPWLLFTHILGAKLKKNWGKKYLGAKLKRKKMIRD